MTVDTQVNTDAKEDATTSHPEERRWKPQERDRSFRAALQPLPRGHLQTDLPSDMHAHGMHVQK